VAPASVPVDRVWRDRLPSVRSVFDLPKRGFVTEAIKADENTEAEEITETAAFDPSDVFHRKERKARKAPPGPDLGRGHLGSGDRPRSPPQVSRHAKPPLTRTRQSFDPYRSITDPYPATTDPYRSVVDLYGSIVDPYPAIVDPYRSVVDPWIFGTFEPEAAILDPVLLPNCRLSADPPPTSGSAPRKTLPSPAASASLPPA